VEELDALPGIGPTTAENIVNYRLEHGLFQFGQDIQNVSGIGAATYDEIKDLIMVGP
jgi:competence protein ComEA